LLAIFFSGVFLPAFFLGLDAFTFFPAFFLAGAFFLACFMD